MKRSLLEALAKVKEVVESGVRDPDKISVLREFVPLLAYCSDVQIQELFDEYLNDTCTWVNKLDDVGLSDFTEWLQMKLKEVAHDL